MNTKVYMIVDITIKDQKTYKKYVARAAPIVEQYGGHYLARCDSVISLSGDWKPERMVIIAFDSLAMLQACFSSEEYTKIRALRETSTVGKAVIVQEC